MQHLQALARHACRASADSADTRVRLNFGRALAYFTSQAFTVRAEFSRNDKRLQT